MANSGGEPDRLVRATLTSEDRSAEYASAVRAGMADLVRAIREPGYTPLVTPEDGLSSLAVALAAQESIDSRVDTAEEGSRDVERA
jgi:hypothetical protein